MKTVTTTILLTLGVTLAQAYRDLETGTFLTRDPIGCEDGPNVYCYVRCNPITRFDPLASDTLDVYREHGAVQTQYYRTDDPLSSSASSTTSSAQETSDENSTENKKSPTQESVNEESL